MKKGDFGKVKQNVLTRAKKKKALAHLHAHHLEAAQQLFEQICETDKRDIESWLCLATVNMHLGHAAEAATCCRHALEVDTACAEALYTLALAQEAEDRVSEAESSYRKAVQLRPNFPEAWNNLGNVLTLLGRTGEAADCYQHSLALQPDNPRTLFNLGNAQWAQGNPEEAARCYEQVLLHWPTHAEAHNNLGRALAKLGRVTEAIEQCEKAIKIRPSYKDAYYNLARAHHYNFALGKAIAYYRNAISLEPICAEPYKHLGNALLSQGRVEEALTCYRKAVEIDPEFVTAHSNLLLATNYRPSLGTQDIFLEHKRWDTLHAVGLDIPLDYGNDRDPKRPLRIGYVSPDFRQHSVAYFFEPILANHARENVETFCYANVAHPDSVTERFKEIADHWRNVFGLADEAMAMMIHDDQIDILVDLAGHTARNRLLVFASKPAPIQITYLGYPNTTGLSTIDYRFTDVWADPPGEDRYCTEQLIRLPHGFLCYSPPDEAPEPSVLPVLDNGCITFGSFNNISKVTEEVVGVWCNILASVPNSRIVLKDRSCHDDATRSHYYSIFASHHIARDRVELLERTAMIGEHLALYRHIDIALDTFPYNGTTTTCEALWMGVPVITLKGNRHAGRVGASLLSNIGMKDLVTSSTDDYVRRACQLSANIEDLARLRQNLRNTMLNSQLCNITEFTRVLEEMYRDCWAAWCQTRSPS